MIARSFSKAELEAQSARRRFRAFDALLADAARSDRPLTFAEQGILKVCLHANAAALYWQQRAAVEAEVRR